MKEIVVDWTRCDGHGLCAALEPHRITRDEWGFPLFHRMDVTPEEQREARRTVAACPTLALRLSTRSTERTGT